MKKYFVAGLLLAAFTVLPSAASAQSIAELQAKIAVLIEQIKMLQNQQNNSGTQWCHTFNRNLGVGIHDDEVSYLGGALMRLGLIVSDNTRDDSAFTELTAAAVSSFQLKYKDEILTPNGLSAPTGYFGPASRKKMNSLYGCKLSVKPPIVTNYSPVINALSTYSGTVGTVVDIRGSNLAGFENDRNVWIESSNGTRGILYGDNSVSTSNMIRVTLKSPLCQTDNSYSGRPCNSWLNLTPGRYSFQVITPSGSSNRLNFEITSGSGNLPPAISGVSGPTTLNVGQIGTWTVQASDPENGMLSYSVIWGDASQNNLGTSESGIPTPQTFTQTATFTHVYNQAGNFYPQFFVKDNSGGNAGTGISVNIIIGGTVANTPHIDSVTPIFGSVGTTIEIKGSNLSGFEGDLIAVFKRADGKIVNIHSIVPYSTVDANGYTIGSVNTTLIKVKVEPPCQRGQTVYGDYSGIPSICDYFEFTPGVYKIYVTPWGKKSNEVQFTVI